ncbi:MAG: M1 family metallopeptidase, partial [Caulobacterales bacterium]|nr:M1 family metallopeptidase [Caulobacterales bacterium]
MGGLIRGRAARLALAAALLVAACGGEEPAPDTPEPVEEVFDPMAEMRAAAPAGRLPEGVRPTAYRLDLTIDPREPRFTGVADIAITLDAPAEGLWMHGKDLDVGDVEVFVDGREEPVPAVYQELLASGVARVSFFEEVPAGAARIRLAYEGGFDETLAGLFRVREGEAWYALVKSESVQARRAFPGFDEPRFKTPFAMSLTIPEGQVAIANTPEIGRESAGEGLVRLAFAETPPLPTYLLSMAVGPFDVVERPAIPPSAIRDRPIPLRGFARAGKGGEMNLILDLTAPFIDALESAFGVAYPYEKLDIVVAPDWPSGATELAAAPTYREDIVLVGDRPAPRAERRVVSIHAHELAHMWFGDYVTPPWWDDLWLKEAFAVWAEPIAGAAIDPEGGYEIERALDAVRGMRADELASARAVREPIERNEVIRSAYDRITYAKGPAVLGMVEAYLGEESWRAGLSRYFEVFGDGVADAQDFYAVMGEAAGDPAVTQALQDFIERPGLPVVEAALSCPADGRPEITLSQRRYRPLGSAISDDRMWTIPACAAFGGGDGRGRVCALMRERRASVALDGEADCPAWVMPNAGGAGYYRFDLDGAGWRALADGFAALEPAEQVVAVDSAGAAFAAGEADASDLMAIIDAAATSSRREVASAAARWLRADAARVLEEDAAGLARLSAYVRATFSARRTALTGSGDPDDRLLRQTLTELLAGVGGDMEARAELARDAAAFVGLEGPREPGALNADAYRIAAIVAA